MIILIHIWSFIWQNTLVYGVHVFCRFWNLILLCALRRWNNWAVVGSGSGGGHDGSATGRDWASCVRDCRCFDYERILRQTWLHICTVLRIDGISLVIIHLILIALRSRLLQARKVVLHLLQIDIFMIGRLLIGSLPLFGTLPWVASFSFVECLCSLVWLLALLLWNLVHLVLKKVLISKVDFVTTGDSVPRGHQVIQTDQVLVLIHIISMRGGSLLSLTFRIYLLR